MYWVITSQYTHVSSHSAVQLKLRTTWNVNHISIKLGGRSSSTGGWEINLNHKGTSSNTKKCKANLGKRRGPRTESASQKNFNSLRARLAPKRASVDKYLLFMLIRFPCCWGLWQGPFKLLWITMDWSIWKWFKCINKRTASHKTQFVYFGKFLFGFPSSCSSFYGGSMGGLPFPFPPQSYLTAKKSMESHRQYLTAENIWVPLGEQNWFEEWPKLGRRMSSPVAPRVKDP